MMSNDRDYFLERAAQEDKAALAATSLKARWVHEELALLYRGRARLGPGLRSGVDAHPADAVKASERDAA